MSDHECNKPNSKPTPEDMVEILKRAEDEWPRWTPSSDRDGEE